MLGFSLFTLKASHCTSHTAREEDIMVDTFPIRRRSILYSLVTIVGLLVPARVLSEAPSVTCPKVLMFDGVRIDKHNNDTAAQYWGQKIGVDGFFVNEVVPDWDRTVGDDEKSPDYQRGKQFQDLYAKYGVTDNFIKIALYKPHNWQDPAAQSRVVTVFRQAAHLAKYAGFKGLALDLETYVKDYWIVDSAFPEKAERVSALGKQIGDAIVSEFPTAVTDIEQVLREKKPFILRCMLDGIKKLQGRMVTWNRCALSVSITWA
jgi:hypothetical protein